MHELRIVTVPIERDFAEAYAFISNPAKMPSWSSISDNGLRQVGPNAYTVELPTGPAHIQLTPPNDFGVLDYAVTPKGSAVTRRVPLRLIANGAGCELIVALFRGEGMSDETFNSEVEWITAEFLVLKTMLEHV